MKDEITILSVPGYMNGTHAEVLREIHAPDVNIAVWERSLTVPVQELQQVLDGLPREVRAHGCVTAIVECLRDTFLASGVRAEALLKDIAMLLEEFSGTALVKDMRLALTAVNGTLCRRFHTDTNDLRLLCTYVGPGTLWLLDDAVNEEALRSRDPDLHIERSAGDILQIPTGHVAIIKGACYPGRSMRACMHRSTTIEESGQRRLLLRIDTNGPMHHH